MALIANPFSAHLGFGIGEIATLASAIAAEILLIGYFVGTVNTARVTVIQLLVAGALGFLFMPVVGEQVPEFSWVWIGGSPRARAGRSWAQKRVDETRATLIYAGEPVWGALIGRLAGERLPALAFVGGALIVIAAVVSAKNSSEPEALPAAPDNSSEAVG